MKKIILFDDRGKLYFNRKDDLILIRDTVVEASEETSLLKLENDSELILYSVNGQDGYMWSSNNDNEEKSNWISELDELFNEDVFVICDYDWSAALLQYEQARERILNAINKSNSNLAFLLYSTVKFPEADKLYPKIKKDFPNNIIAAEEAITFGEFLGDMNYAFANEIPDLF